MTSWQGLALASPVIGLVLLKIFNYFTGRSDWLNYRMYRSEQRSRERQAAAEKSAPTDLSQHDVERIARAILAPKRRA